MSPPPQKKKKNYKNRKEGCDGGGSQSIPPTTTSSIHTHTARPVVPGANPSGARPVPLDPLDHILVWAALAGWSHCVTLALHLTQYRYVPCGPDYQGDCVNSPANLRKYPVGIFVKPASATDLVFHLGSL